MSGPGPSGPTHPSRRRAVVVVVGVLAVVVAAAAAFAATRTPTYASTAVVRLTTATTGPGSAHPDGSFTLPDPVQQVESTAVVRRADGALGGAGRSAGSEDVVATYQPGTGEVAITARAGSPARAQEVARAYSEAYVDQTQAEATARSGQLGREIASLATRITTLQAEPGSDTDTLIQAQITAATQTYASLQTDQYELQLGEPYAVVDVVADLPTTPVGPSGAAIVALAALCGLAVGAVVALLDRRAVRRRVAARPGSTVVPDQPTAPEPDPMSTPVPVADDPPPDRPSVAPPLTARPPVAPSVDALRDDLDELVEDGSRPVVVVTSPRPGVAKSRVVVDLGVAWALAGRSVVVVSADFRHPLVEELLGVEAAGRAGLSDLIRSRRDGLRQRPSAPREARQPSGSGRQRRDRGPASPSGRSLAGRSVMATAVDGLRILPAGTRLDDPSDLVSSRGMHMVLEDLRRLADVVVVDTPPASSLRDAGAIARLSAGPLVLVSEEGGDDGSLAQATIELEATSSQLVTMAFDPADRDPVEH